MKIINKFGVDAGNIGVYDLAAVKKRGGKFGETAERMSQLVHLSPGKYTVTINIPKCWRGCKKQTQSIETTGDVVIGDVCYIFSSDEVAHEVWMSFLKETNYLKNPKPFGFSVDTGGDGEFSTTVSFTKED